MKQPKYQIIKIHVPDAGDKVKLSASTDKLYEKVTGIAASLPFEGSLFGSTLELKIADKEIFPEEYEIKRLCTGQETGLNERFMDVEVEAAGSTIELEYIDGGVTEEVTFPYTVLLYLRLEEKRK